jgi:short-subunit dehydrogenase
MNAIVTGATKGIGKAIVVQLAAHHYDVAFCARNQEEIDKFLKELKNSYPNQRFYGIKADMENLSEVKKFADFALKNLGSANVLVNNAGLYIPTGIFDEHVDDLERQMKVNVYAPHYLSKFFTQSMKNQSSGYIINICSIASLKPISSAASYSISKAALLSQTRAFREALMPFGIKVTAILPGATLTDSWAGTSLPAERFVSANDVALAVLTCLQMSAGANLDEIIIRPLKGEI